MRIRVQPAGIVAADDADRGTLTDALANETVVENETGAGIRCEP